MSALENIQVCFLDDRDPVRQGQERWKVRPIRKVGRVYEIQINGVWCDAAAGDREFKRGWEVKGYAVSQYGTVHRDYRRTASNDYGYGLDSNAGIETPLSIKACAVLGVHWPVEPDEVKRAYRRLVKEAHPDVGGDQERFRQIQEAYEALKEVLEVAV